MKRLSRMTLPIGITTTTAGIIGFIYFTVNKVIVDTCGSECNGSICLDICIPIFGYSPLRWVAVGATIIGLSLIGYRLFINRIYKTK